MKRKPVFLIAVTLTFAFSLVLLQSCKDEAVVETKTNTNQNPEGPNLLSPLNNATLNNSTPTLDWDNFYGALSYRVQISLDANFAGTMLFDSSGITQSEINIPPAVLPSGAYNYWRVNALTSSGTSPWSAVWRFHIILAPPDAPVLISPPDGSINQPWAPVLDWNDVATAQFYRLQIAANSSFNQLVLDSNRIFVSQFQVPQYALQVNSLYYWRVNASNSGGVSTGPWSAPWSFTTMNGPEPNSISGTITFVDANFLPPPGFYKVGAFEIWPPSLAPLEYDSLNIQQIGGVFKANYKITNVLTGSYYIAVYPETGISLEVKVLGIYGCDTVHVNYSNCPNNPSTVNIINNWGIENINFLSWADTTQKIF